MCQHSEAAEATVEIVLELMTDQYFRLLIVARNAFDGKDAVRELYQGLTLPEAAQVIDLETARFFADPF